MSQAVAAPNTGEYHFTVGKSDSSTDIIPKIVGRRGLLAGIAFASAALAVPALASGPKLREDPMSASRRIDATFWRLHGRERRLYRQWMASFERMRGSPHSDAVTGNWCARHSLAETALIFAGVRTLPALHAKLEIIRQAEMDCEMQLSSGLRAHDVVLFDVERLMKQELMA